MDQQCPLCGSAAVSEPVGGGAYRRYRCPVCTTFFIDPPSEAHIASWAEVFKSESCAELSRHAQTCPPDCVFVIRVPTSDEIGGDGHSVARTRMVAGCVNPESEPAFRT